MRYAMIVAGLIAIVWGGMFTRGSQQLDAQIAAVIIICGVVALTAGVAACEIINELKDRDATDLTQQLK